MELTRQAIQVLEMLQQFEEMSVSGFEEEGMDQSKVNRAALELEEKDLVEVNEETQKHRELTERGEKVVRNGSPEYRLLQRVKEGQNSLSELSDLDIDVALGKARKQGWIDVENGEVELEPKGQEVEEDKLKEQLQDRDFSGEHVDRNLVEEKEKTLRKIEITQKGEKIDPDEVDELFNVESRAETPRTGKKHFYKSIIDFARQKWLEMGFQEMHGDYVVPSFLNFDALYTPQDHPARELHDTFFMERPSRADLDEYGDKVDHVKETHENGWETGSTGWGYDWKNAEARKNVLRTHTTAISARRLHDIDINEEELPKKFFIVGRNFRNETVDRTHLAEFMQTDGIVVGRDLNFANLKGYISEFFEKMGYSEFRLIPSYYPYTEMSVEVQVWDEEDEEWLGMGGAGMFRPEVVKPMLGFEAKVLAWGLGIPRIAMIAAELEDVRELYRNDIEIITETSVWRPDA